MVKVASKLVKLCATYFNGGVYIHIFMFWPTDSFQIHQLEFDLKRNLDRT